MAGGAGGGEVLYNLIGLSLSQAGGTSSLNYTSISQFLSPPPLGGTGWGKWVGVGCAPSPHQ